MASKSVGLLNIVFGADLRGFERAMKKAQKNIKKFGSSMKKTGASLSRNLTMPIVALGVVGVRAFDKQQKAIAQMEAGLKSTGGQVGITSKELQKMAADLQKTTLFGDEEILQGATAQLLTFTNIAGEQFERTQVVALDLATRLDGDLKSASIMLGKALNDPVANLSALSRAGIQFSEDQKKTVKSLVETNRLADAQTLILAELETQYGGSAAAAAAAGLGPIQQLGNALSDMSEDIGAALLPMIQDLANWIKKIADKFDGLDDSTKKTIVKIALLAAALGPVLMIIGQMSIGISALIPVFAGLNAVMAANPIGAIITAIVALVAGFYWLITSSSDTARTIRNAFIFMANGVISSINLIISAINKINPFKQIKPIKLFAYEAKEELEKVEDGAKNAATEIGKLSTAVTTIPTGGGGGGGFTPTAIPMFKAEESEAKGMFEPIEKEWEDTTKSMAEQTEYTVGVMISNFQEGMDKVKTIMSSVSGLISAVNKKEQAEFDILRDGKNEKLDEDYERELERIENSIMNDEAKKDAIATLDEDFAEKKGALDEQMDLKEKAIQRKQAIRDKAMGIMSATISGIEAVMNVFGTIAFPASIPIAAIVGTIAAANVAAIASTPIPVFAEGGIVTGPTVGLIGEAGPEAILPLNKLSQIMGEQHIMVTGKLIGNDIYLSNKKAEFNRVRTV